VADCGHAISCVPELAIHFRDHILLSVVTGRGHRTFPSHSTSLYTAGTIKPAIATNRAGTQHQIFLRAWKVKYRSSRLRSSNQLLHFLTAWITRPPSQCHHGVSEAHGYGMLIFALMGATTRTRRLNFRRQMYRYFSRNHQSSITPYPHGVATRSTGCVNEPTGATIRHDGGSRHRVRVDSGRPAMGQQRSQINAYAMSRSPSVAESLPPVGFVHATGDLLPRHEVGSDGTLMIREVAIHAVEVSLRVRVVARHQREDQHA